MNNKQILESIQNICKAIANNNGHHYSINNAPAWLLDANKLNEIQNYSNNILENIEDSPAKEYSRTMLDLVIFTIKSNSFNNTFILDVAGKDQVLKCLNNIMKKLNIEL